MATMRNESDRHRVVVIAPPDVPIYELAIPCEIFGTDRRDLTPDWYDFELVTSGADVRSSVGMLVPEGRGVAACADADTVIVPACDAIRAAAPPSLLAAVRDAHARGARIVALCTGAFALAEAGLLDGRRATTHWMNAPDLAEMYPAVQVDPDVLYVHDDVWTSAGSSAGLDLCLEIVRQDLGGAVANEIARRVVTPPHRDGGQAQFIRPRPVASGATEMADVLHWARTRLDSVTVSEVADRAGVSARTLHRNIRSLTGRSMQAWLQRERLYAAQELLESTSLTVEAIAARTGMGSATNLRHHFAQAFGVPPSRYRATFGERVS